MTNPLNIGDTPDARGIPIGSDGKPAYTAFDVHFGISLRDYEAHQITTDAEGVTYSGRELELRVNHDGTRTLQTWGGWAVVEGTGDSISRMKIGPTEIPLTLRNFMVVSEAFRKSATGKHFDIALGEAAGEYRPNGHDASDHGFSSGADFMRQAVRDAAVKPGAAIAAKPAVKVA